MLGAIMQGAKRMGLPSDRLAGILYPPECLVTKDQPMSANFGLEHVEFVPVLKSGEGTIREVEFLKRAKTLEGDFGLCDAEVLIMDQANLPGNLRGLNIYFAAAEIMEPYSDPFEVCLSIPYMAFSEQRQAWVIRFHPVKIFPRSGQIVVMASIFHQNSLVPKFKA
ncbi:MAG: hypothetical protein NT034_00060 [Candidatus Magasanikbacteria bacterium]|nr:hypothetical protein [Candidatus Magasanikbacteria bacterium]